MKQKMQKEYGAITIEATISLTAFMFAIVTILTIVNICIAQARIATAINATAKEISQYSYLYSLTGFSKSEAELAEAGKKDTEELNTILEDVNTVFNEIENLGKAGKSSVNDVKDIAKAWDSAVGSMDKIEAAGSSLKDTMKDIAKDPKHLMFGIAKLAASKTMEIAKSRLIAAPLSKAMCEKHLVSSHDTDAEDYLKHLGVVPAANGSYVDGLDFSQSTIFPYGSNRITINVSYDVKIIELLPIDITFHFNQTAVTNGWLAGDASFKSSNDYVENDTLWTKATIDERSGLIRHMVISDMEDTGYQKTCGLTDVQMYSKEKNEFLMISSMNPLYSGQDEETKSLDDIDEQAIIKSIELLCGKMKSTTDGLTEVTTKNQIDGTTTKTVNNCTGATNKIILVIPEDEGLKAKIEAIIAKANTQGVTIEVVPSYGNGANKSSTMKPGDKGE